MGHRTLVLCPSCGRDPGEGRFCRGCGVQLDSGEAAAPVASEIAVPVPLGRQLLVALLALGVAATVMLLLVRYRDVGSEVRTGLPEPAVDATEASTWGATAAVIQDWQLQIGSVSAAPDAIVVTTFAGVTALGPHDGRLLWQRRVDPGWSAVAVVGDLAVVREVARDGLTEMRGIEAATGITRWSRRDLVEPLPVPAGGGVVLVRERAVKGGDGPALLRLDPASGATLWEAAFTGDLVGAAVAGEVLVVQTLWSEEILGEDRRLRVDVTAHDLADGTTRWALDTEPVMSQRARSTVPPVAGGPDTAIVSDAAGRVIALDAATGAERWRDAGPRQGAVLAVVGDLALYGTLGGELRAVNVTTGGVRWETATVGVRDATRILGDDSGIAVFHVGSRAAILDVSDGTELARTNDLRSSAAAFHDGRLVVGSFTGEVAVVEPTTARTLWTTPVLPHVAAWLAAGPDLVFVTVPDQTTVAAFDARSGEFAWRRRLLGWGISAPIADGSERVVVRNAMDVGGAGTATVALGVDSGEIEWTSVVREGSGWGAWLGPVAMTPFAVIDESEGTLRGLDRRTGEVLWSLQLGGPGNGVTAIVGGEPLAFAATADGTLVAIDPSDGSVRWQMTLPSRAVWVTAADDMAVVVGEDAALRAVDGEVRWEVQLEGLASQAPLVSGDTIVVADGRLLGLSRAGGRVRWELPIGQPLAGPPAAIGESVAFATADGAVHLVATATGRTLRQHLVSERILAGPVPCGARLCVLTVDGRLRPGD